MPELSKRGLALTGSVAALIGGLSASAAVATPALPTGGQVAAGQASIARSSTSTLTVSQTSSRAIVDWSSFSIGQGGTVRFDNGSGATLNRVTGTNISSIDGFLSASGSVYLINPNGVIIGRSGVVSTGGTFVASTQDLTNAEFMTGGTLTFAGDSTAAVLNLGKVGSLGGDVALIASRVENDGSITASQGDVGLAAGYQVTMSDATQNDGKFQVLVGGSRTSATNAGSIQAAEAELRANGGNVYALAGDTGGIIQATGVSKADGKVLLIAQDGTVTANGTIAARSSTGAGGEVETSGERVDFAGLTVKAGSWLVDPTNLTVNPAAATTIDAALAAGTSVTLETTSTTPAETGVTGVGVTSSGAGDITIASALGWSTAAKLTLDAYHSIVIDAGITNTGSGDLVLRADDTGVGAGTVSFGANGEVAYSKSTGLVAIFYDPADNPAGSALNATSYTAPTDYAAKVATNSAEPDQLLAYMLVNTVYDLQDIENNPAGDYALGRNINASATKTWNPSTVDNETVYGGFVPIEFNGSGAFTGILDGLDHTVSNLYENWGADALALFGYVGPSGVIQNLKLADVSFYFGAGTIYAGVIAANNAGLIENDSATGNLSAAIDGAAGGLVGANASTGVISGSNSAVKVTYVGALGAQGTDYGGLVGQNYGVVETSHAAGSVTDEADSANLGGLIGFNNGSEGEGVVETSYATGKVVGGTSALGGGANVGGLVGYDLGAASTKDALPASMPAATSFVPGEIYLSYATGAVVDMGAHAFVGGLVGDVDQNGGLLGDHATGTVTGGSDGAYGGLAGVSDNGGGIIDSYASGKVTVGVGDEVGGLVGLNAGDGGIVGSWAFGNVLAGSADAANAYATKAGGLVGDNQTLISGAYALGSVTVGATTSESEGAIAYAGGLVGIDYGGTLNQVFAAGQVKGGAGSEIGGLSGGSGEGVTAGYWDTQTSGLSTSAEGTGLTTAQLQAKLPSGFAASSWGIIAGKSFPYLLIQFDSLVTGKSEGSPGAISGTISGLASDSGQDVDVTIDGAATTPAASMTSGANGYYYDLLAPGSIASGSKVQVAIADGATFDDAAAGSIAGLDITAGTLSLISNAARYSTLETEIDTTLGDSSSVDGVAQLESAFGVDKLTLDDTDASGFILDRAISDGSDGVTIKTNGELTLAGKVSADALDLVSGGSIRQLSTGALTAATLTGHSGGATALTAANKITDLGAFTDTAGAFNLTDDSALSITGLVDVSGRILKLTDTGAIAENGSGAIDAAALIGSAGGAARLNGANQIASLGAFTDTAAAFSLTDDGTLSITGLVDSNGRILTLIDTGAITESGSGAIDAALINVTAQTGIDLDSSLNSITTIGTDKTSAGVNVIDK